jgi:hypothetical protein
VTLTSPYALPFRVLYPQDLGSTTPHLAIRIHQAEAVSASAAEAFDSTVIPFLLMVTSGALAGAAIPPWAPAIESWHDPIVRGSMIEWSLESVTCDPQAWVMLAQMLQIDHEDHAIAAIEYVNAQGRSPMTEVATGKSQVNPYPSHWPGIRFPIEVDGDLPKSFTVHVDFSRSLSEAEKENIQEECGAWAPGLMIGAYGVAPVRPDRCTGFPDEEIGFLDSAFEWSIARFKAHTGAIDGLLNVLAAVSEKIVPVTRFRIE